MGEPTATDQRAPGSSARGARLLAAGLVLLAVVAGLAPYTGPLFGFVLLTRPLVEVVDHVVPAGAVVAVAGYGIASARLPLWAALVAVLAGFWMTATHVPLLAQAADGGIDLPTALWHSVPGIVLLLAAAGAAAVAWAGEREA